MSEASPEAEATPSEETPVANEFVPITSQEDLNRVTGDRVKRAEAKFADAVAKAAKFDELQAANQTEAQRATARIAELEDALNGERAASQRLAIAARHGITDADDIELFLTGNDEETLTRQAQRLADREADRKKQGNRVPREGQTPSSASDSDELTTVRGLFGS